MKLGSLVSLIPLVFIAFENAGQASTAALTSDSGGIITPLHSRDISEAASVNSAIDAMANSAAICRKTTGRAPLECECSSKADLLKLRSAYDVAVTSHPAWAVPGKTVLWTDPDRKRSIGVNFSAVARLLNICERK